MDRRFFDLLATTPALYAPSDAPFWDDEHISSQMLSAHLDENMDAASRKPAFIARSAEWIRESFLPKGGTLLDLGCGPGLYDERFARSGLNVTGVDLSRRSIAYARESACKAGLDIHYLQQNYLTLDFSQTFDLAVMIYCDFGVLSPADRHDLLKRVRRSVKPGGRIVLDAWSPEYWNTYRTGRTVEYDENGFWSPGPYVCVTTCTRFPKTENYLDQHVVATPEGCRCYNIWNQIYTPETLASELSEGGFPDVTFFGDIAGAPLDNSLNTLCAVAR